VAKAKKAATSTEANGKANGQAVSKIDAMRQTLATLGKDASNQDIEGHLKKTFGLTLSPATFSNYKSVASNEGGKKKKKKGRKAVQKVAETAAAPAASTSFHGRSNYSIEDIRAVQELAGRLGAKKLQELAEVLAK